MLQVKRTLSLFIVVALLFVQVRPSFVFAEEVAPTPAAAPTIAAVAPTAPVAPETPQTPELPSNAPEVTATPTPKVKTQEEIDREAKRAAAEAAYKASLNPQPTSAPSATSPKAGGNVGDTVINTGNANNSSATITTANNNGATTGTTSLGNGTGGAIVNSGNGAGSTNNSGSAAVVNDNTTQNNSAVVGTDLNQASNTGNNETGMNVGDTTIKTGNANTSGTAITAINTNADNVSVSEFNIVDDHKGDIVLTPELFAANCILGCGALGGTVENTGNGANSNNTADASTQMNNGTFQNNDGTVGNNMVLSANSGNNGSSLNTGGDTTIQTGDANVSANALTFVNNNIAGNVQLNVVNIYGNLEGDLVLPEFTNGPVQTAGTGSTTSNTGNGANSDNNAATSTDVNNTLAQNNDVIINNELILNGTTGDNNSGYNTDGNTTIQTGETNVDANVLNIANSNISGGTWWLVLVNEAGNWVGHLIGAPDNAHVAGSEGTSFTTGPDGQITASTGNANNGAGSSNTANNSSSTNNTTTQNNTGVINNTLNLTANTGGNTANSNTGGDTTIQTGDANIIANLVNFVNNNIVGNGNLVVTVVNVFGGWVGDLVTPGQQKAPKPTPNTTEVAAQNVTPTGTTTTQSNTTVTTTVNQSSTTVTPEVTPVVYSNSGTYYTHAIQNNPAKSYKAGSVFNFPGLGEKSVAGASSDSSNLIAQAYTDPAKKKLTINLAWFILAFPLAASFIFRKNISRRIVR